MYKERRQPRESCPYCRRSVFTGYLPAHIQRCKKEAQIIMSDKSDPQEMGKWEKGDPVRQVLHSLDMIGIAVHHERCQATVAAAASIVQMLVDDDEAFAAMLRIHLQVFPDESPEKLRDGYRTMVSVLMHVAEKHEAGMRNHVLKQAGLGEVEIEITEEDSERKSVFTEGDSE